MSNRCLTMFAVVITFFFASVAAAQSPVVYPAKGQSAQQTAKDKQACTAWAQQQGSAYHAADQRTLTNPMAKRRLFESPKAISHTQNYFENHVRRTV